MRNRRQRTDDGVAIIDDGAKISAHQCGLRQTVAQYTGVRNTTGALKRFERRDRAVPQADGVSGLREFGNRRRAPRARAENCHLHRQRTTSRRSVSA